MNPAIPGRMRLPLGIAATLGAVLVVSLGLAVADTAQPTALDRRVDIAIGNPPSAAWSFAHAADSAGEPLGAIVIVGVVSAACLLLRHRRLAAVAVIGTIASVTATILLKPAFERYIHEDSLAYPSGHTAFAVAIGMVVALLLTDVLGMGRVGGVLLLVSAVAIAGAVMGWAQVLLDSHYATDAIGGACCATVAVVGTAWLIDTLSSPSARRS